MRVCAPTRRNPRAFRARSSRLSQYDNAQRTDECGYGVRLSSYEFTDDEPHGTIDRLAADLIEEVIRS